MESVAAFVWNGWQLCRGISGRVHLESVAAFPWNTHVTLCILVDYISPAYTATQEENEYYALFRNRPNCGASDSDCMIKDAGAFYTFVKKYGSVPQLL